MEREKCRDCLVKYYLASIKKPSQVYVVPLLAKLTGKQWEQLQAGDGNPIAEVFQINSSAGLAVNYYKLYEQTHDVEISFEWRESIPLLKSHKAANIDVYYQLNNTVYFVESKFLEPYCDNPNKNPDAYRDKERYPFKNNVENWLKLMEVEDEFRYFDFSQMYRHLLAIYRHYLEKKEFYEKKQIVLQSVSWKMTDAFKKEYGLSQADEDMLINLDDERKKANKLFNEFLKDIGWTNCRFETKYYNDMLNEIKTHPKYDEFCKQYFFD